MSRRRAQPHGANRPPHPNTGQTSTPDRRSNSTATSSTPTVNTGCTPMHQEGPSVSVKTCGRALDSSRRAHHGVHTTINQTGPNPTPTTSQDHPTMTPSASPSLAVNTWANYAQAAPKQNSNWRPKPLTSTAATGTPPPGACPTTPDITATPPRHPEHWTSRSLKGDHEAEVVELDTEPGWWCS
jgi:hypothetical protein